MPIFSPVLRRVAAMVVVFLGMFGSGTVRADVVAWPAVSLPGTQLRPLPRSANGSDYVLYIALPESHGRDPARRYPVLYQCDPYWDFALIKGFYGNLTYDEAASEFIIVGIGYQGAQPNYERLRMHDYTPSEVPGLAPNGEASAFLGVLEKEIIPLIEREYQADPSYRVISGSSLGGLFSLYAVLSRPGLFQACIAVSPAVGWDRDWLFALEERTAGGASSASLRVFMSGAGAEDAWFLSAIRRFDQQISRRQGTGWFYRYREIDGERHAGTKAEGYNRGVRFVFAPLAPKPSE